MNIIFQTHLKKKVVRLPKKVRRALGERLELFKSNPFNPILNNHMLHGKYEGYRSINITGDYRLIFEVISSDAIAVIDFDTHHSLYGS
jgi:addiction module RelE/StbE family toxin